MVQAGAPFYTDEALALISRQELKESVRQLLKEKGKKVKDSTIDTMVEIGVPPSKIPSVCEALCTLVMEYYGFKPWELADPDSIVKRFSLSDKQIELLLRYGGLSQTRELYSRFTVKEAEGMPTKTLEMPTQMNVVKMPDAMVDSILGSKMGEHAV